MFKNIKVNKLKNGLILFLTCIILLNYLGMFNYVVGNVNHDCIKYCKEICMDMSCDIAEPHEVNNHKDLQCNICDKLALYTLILKSYIAIVLFVVLTLCLNSSKKLYRGMISQAKVLITLLTLKVRLDIGKRACI